MYTNDGFEALLEVENGTAGFNKTPILAVWTAVVNYLKKKKD